MFPNSWFISRKQPPKDNKHIPVSRAVTTETTLSKGQECFSPGTDSRGGEERNINWERCRCVIAVVDNMDNASCLDKYFKQLMEDFKKKDKIR